MEVPILDDVVGRLAAWKGHWRAIAVGADVPYDTVTKIAQRKTKNPGVQTISKLHLHLTALGDPPKAAVAEQSAA